ncbi:MAG: hypothetical protein K1X49_12930 [Saprospiraceae bacterium]|nr:hypothetical protein [Saprospiraceae bacterium]
MDSIRQDVERLRKWFIDNNELNDYVRENIENKFNEVISLLEQGEKMNLWFNAGFSYMAVNAYLVANFKGRLQKILNPEKIYLTGEPDATADELYYRLQETMMFQLFDHQPH